VGWHGELDVFGASESNNEVVSDMVRAKAWTVTGRREMNH
jgi:hypothetical protein